ncbi:hypothetical protein FQA39_LY04879 [Lamprigera yunnana]|nr:hypothetical protein FQA39_LY04879 [Lamprigera yunnana]
MDVYRLVRDKLEYELIVRGVDGGTARIVLSMRKILSDLISKENVGVLVNELRDISGNVQEFSKTVTLRIEARLHHICGRIHKLKLVAADNLVVSSKINDLGYVEEFKELFDDKDSATTKGRHEPGLETEQEDPTEIKRVNFLKAIKDLRATPPIQIPNCRLWR